ncbi:hypothetical protein RhiirC2_320656 [Rhizophagus irregularis]|uniref:Uncharacterized protein n=1 Tax=Rhizophagus irregularis TaxID=588596 RepID=A0A2N1MAN7_9GLOM|nr:hypothetical protein RhiirC2_320656 [Rhizophagus irregularis]
MIPKLKGRNEGDYYGDDGMYDEGCYYKDKGYYHENGRCERKVLPIESGHLSSIYTWEILNNCHLKCAVRYRRDSCRRIGAVRRAICIYTVFHFSELICVYFLRVMSPATLVSY